MLSLRRLPEKQPRQPKPRLKLEVDEGIAISLSKNDRAGHESPYRVTTQGGAADGGFDTPVAQRPVHENMPGVTSPICHMSRVVRIASPCGWPPNIPPSMRVATVKSVARKKTQATQTAQ